MDHVLMKILHQDLNDVQDPSPTFRPLACANLKPVVSVSMSMSIPTQVSIIPKTNQSSATALPKKSSIQSRGDYWTAQATSFIRLIKAGTEFDTNNLEEAAPGAKFGHTVDYAQKADQQLQEEEEDEEDMWLSDSDSATILALLHATENSSSSRSTSAVPIQSHATSICLKRLCSVINILFDSNFTRLEHRRANVNCARYVSAKADEVFGASLGTRDSNTGEFCTLLEEQYSVSLGPFLNVVMSSQQWQQQWQQQEEPIFLSQPEGLEHYQRRHKEDVIAPPKRLTSTFQVMLWHRCFSGLIALYGIVQRRHISEKKTVRKRSESMPALPDVSFFSTLPTLSSPQQTVVPVDPRADTNSQSSPQMNDNYPFCCSAHSLVFSSKSSHKTAASIRIRGFARRATQNNKFCKKKMKNSNIINNSREKHMRLAALDTVTPPKVSKTINISWSQNQGYQRAAIF
ncbi:hypothetical protein BG004_001068 [Podila humilis]|nr:hypothetical protein BG004_001068 [Podila humilis]